MFIFSGISSLLSSELGSKPILSSSEIDEVTFYKITKEITSLYEERVTRLGKELIVNADWKSDVPNATAQQEGDRIIINIWGGIARWPGATKDGLALLVCHELGHHFGGYPSKRSERLSWASSESQSYYWAVLKCLRKYFSKDENVKIVESLNVDSHVRKMCDLHYKTQEEEALCIRSAMAGDSYTNMYRFLRGKIKEEEAYFGNPNSPVTSEIQYDESPSLQCMLDTFLSASLCQRDFNEEVSFIVKDAGVCSRDQGEDAGARPLCWYKP